MSMSGMYSFKHTHNQNLRISSVKNITEAGTITLVHRAQSLRAPIPPVSQILNHNSSLEMRRPLGTKGGLGHDGLRS